MRLRTIILLLGLIAPAWEGGETRARAAGVVFGHRLITTLYQHSSNAGACFGGKSLAVLASPAPYGATFWSTAWPPPTDLYHLPCRSTASLPALAPASRRRIVEIRLDHDACHDSSKQQRERITVTRAAQPLEGSSSSRVCASRGPSRHSRADQLQCPQLYL